MHYKNIYLLLGSNLYDRVSNLKMCIEQISTFSKITEQSSIYETEAWGETNQPNFLNQALQIETDFPATELLNQCLQTEKNLGRVRNEKWKARTIDIDMIYFGNEIIKGNDLIIPHPRLTERRFALIPLCEIAPDFIHPILKKTNQELLNESKDSLAVKLFIN